MKTKLLNFLKRLGLTDEEAATYTYLVENGDSSVLAISRGLSTGRTKLYPLLANLEDKQLIAASKRRYGTTYAALPLDSLDYLVKESERESELLRSFLPTAKSNLEDLASNVAGGTKVYQFTGPEGLKQANYNLTKAKGEYRVLEAAPLQEHYSISKHYADKLRQIWVDKGIRSYDLTNDPNWSVEGNNPNYADLSAARYIDPEVFTIEFETFIYNDVVTLLNYEADDVLCLEIHSPALAKQQKQIYELLWCQAKPIKDFA